MMRTKDTQPQLQVAWLYIGAGVAAIVAGGAISAFAAKQPSTLAMWASAYLVLVVGVSQVCFGWALERMAAAGSRLLQYLAFALYNAGNALVIAGSVVKYAGLEWNMPLTTSGSVLLVASLVLLGWLMRGARASWQKAGVYGLAVVLAVCVPIGVILALQRG